MGEVSLGLPTVLEGKSFKKIYLFTCRSEIAMHLLACNSGSDNLGFSGRLCNRWAEQNVDPALYSKEFMAHAEAAVSSEEVCFKNN